MIIFSAIYQEMYEKKKVIYVLTSRRKEKDNSNIVILTVKFFLWRFQKTTRGLYNGL